MHVPTNNFLHVLYQNVSTEDCMHKSDYTIKPKKYIAFNTRMHLLSDVYVRSGFIIKTCKHILCYSHAYVNRNINRQKFRYWKVHIDGTRPIYGGASILKSKSTHLGAVYISTRHTQKLMLRKPVP